MVSGDTTIQDILNALAPEIAKITKLKAVYPADTDQIQKTPCVVLSYFSDVDTAITHGSTQLWVASARATLLYAPIVGNNPKKPITGYNDLIHEIVDVISQQPSDYPFDSAMNNLPGLSRCQVSRVRTSQFGLEYAGSRYFGAELFLDIKLHRRVAYE